MALFKKKTAAAEAVAAETSADDIMRKYDKESNTRIWEGVPKIVMSVVCAAFSLYCMYMTLFSNALPEKRLSLFLGFVTIIGYLNYPVKKTHVKPNSMPWYDILLMTAGAFCFFWFAFNAKPIIDMRNRIEVYLVVLGIAGILILIELCRRCVGLPIICVATVLVAYTFYNKLSAPNNGFLPVLKQIIAKLFYSTDGIIGTPINVCFTYIVLFIIFGAFLERTGIAEFFIAFANRIAGWASGGPAKVAVISSALCGMVSGSSVGNTVTTGSVTIPMMKKTGYKPEFAGAVEAAASTGGQIMPPIMGAAAFLMAEYMGLPYSSVAVKAILPAVLYFTGIFIAVHLEAKKLGLKGISKEMLPRWIYLAKNIYLMLPLVLLVTLVATGARTMAYSAAISIGAAALIGAVRMSKWSDLIKNLSVYCSCAAFGLANLLFKFLGEEYATKMLSEKISFKTAVLVAVTALVFIIFAIIGTATAVKREGKEEAVVKPLATTGKTVTEALVAGGKGAITVAVACAMAGIIAGCITVTGLASIIIGAIVKLAGNATIIGLVLTMLCCIVLGMGVPTTANYCIMAATCAPILIELGFPAVAAHFFVFYFGIVADITPPVALAAYAGSAIAKSNPMKTGINATKLAIAAFIVPYIFAYSPALLFDGNIVWYDVVIISVSAILGLFGVAAAINGYLFGNIPWPLRLVIAAGGLAMMIPGTVSDLAGVVAVAAVVLFQYFVTRKKHKPAGNAAA